MSVDAAVNGPPPTRGARNANAVARALRVLHERRGNLFVTGRAGTGKTAFLERARTEMEDAGREVAVVAFSGMAAVQAGGQTIHSFFGLELHAVHPDGPAYPAGGRKLKALPVGKREVAVTLDLLFVDEVSMVRADILDAIDHRLRIARKRPDEPFGGVQVCLIGDAFQLPPVVTTGEERALLRDAYGESFAFFAARVFDRDAWTAVELPEVMRQRGGGPFVEVLNRIRVGDNTAADLAVLNERVVPPYAVAFTDDDDAPLLTSTNASVAERNRTALARLTTPLHRFDGTTVGRFEERNRPAPNRLELRVGALVLFVRNDRGAQGRYVNGTLGVVSAIVREIVTVTTRDGTLVNVTSEVWDQSEYFYDVARRTLRARVVGSYTQIPLKLAYAMTIHKSQGLSLDTARVDVSSTFLPGQTYVALSRVRSLEGLLLERPVRPRDVKVDPAAIAFQRWVDAQQDGARQRAAGGSGRPFRKTSGLVSAGGLMPRFVPPKLPRATAPSDGEEGAEAAVVVAHATDAGRARTRAELEAEIEALRRQRDELLRVVRRMQRVVAGVGE